MSTTRPLKRPRIENQLKDGILSPPKLVSSVFPIESFGFGIEFLVPSTKDDCKMHKVLINVISNDNINKMQYGCTCDDGKNVSANGVCKHIKAVTLYMMRDLIQLQVDADKTNDLIRALCTFNMKDDIKPENMNVS
jgi:hypothetical protein